MTAKGSPKTTRPYTKWLSRAWQFLSRPHPSIQQVGQRRRAQLSAMISLILTGLFIFAFFFWPGCYSAFIAFLIINAISYGLSRTRYHRAGSYIFSYGITSLAYVSLVLGTTSSFEAAS